MNSITRGQAGKKSRTNGSSLYMYCQTPHNAISRKPQSKGGVRSYSNKRERVTTAHGSRPNDKRWNLDGLASIKHKYANNRIIDLSDSKSRKRLNNCYSKTGYYPTGSNEGRYSSHGTRKQIMGDSDSNKPPLSNIPNFKRGSLSNTPLIKLDDQEQKKIDTFNNTVKTDKISTNLHSIFSHQHDFNRKKRSYYNSSAIQPSMFNRKKKLGAFKKRKKKCRKSVLSKGATTGLSEYPNVSQIPDSTHALISTQYFQDNHSCQMQDEIHLGANMVSLHVLTFWISGLSGFLTARFYNCVFLVSKWEKILETGEYAWCVKESFPVTYVYERGRWVIS